MNRIDRLIAWMAPRMAVKRQIARLQIEAYKAAQPNRLHSAIREGRDPNTPVRAAGVSLREQARALEQDNDIARKALAILVNKTVGTGLTPEPMVMRGGEPWQDMNDRIADLYALWSERPEISWHHDVLSAQRIEARTLFRDGEVFSQHVEGRAANLNHWPASGVPYSFELIEPDLVPMDLNGQGIIQGIAVNQWRQARAYYVYKDYPSAMTPLVFNADSEQFKVVQRERMEHMALTDRIGQLRGVSVFASVIQRLSDIDEIDEAERVAARIAAAFCAFIEKGNADMYAPNAKNKQGDPVRELSIQPGQIFDDLLPGERVGTMDSNRPNNEVIAFRDANIRAAAGGLGVGASHLMNKYDNTYTAARQELVEQEVDYDVLSAYLIAFSAKPKYERFVNMARMAGLLPGSGQADDDSLFNASWASPAMPWVDPQKEISAAVDAIDAGITSRIHVQRERGLSPRQVARERARDAEIDEQFAPDEPEAVDPSAEGSEGDEVREGGPDARVVSVR